MSTATIAAMATAPAPAGVAVIRISGPDAPTALRRLFRSKTDLLQHPRLMVYGKFVDPTSGVIVDRGLAVYMPPESSFTGEAVVEFHTHGSPLIVRRLLNLLYASGISPAGPGEFTKRAFLSGKIDLAQAEAIGDLITATSEHAAKLAGEQLAGRYSKAVENLGEPLRDALAELEASIDFPEEGIEPQALAAIDSVLAQAEKQIQGLVSSYQFGSKVREGYRVLLCGAPNVGKSSILNLLLGRQRAIVSEVSGTTRDLIEEEASIEGYRFVFCDSAGLTKTEDAVEKIGVELAKERLAWADLVLLVVDAAKNDESWRETLGEIRDQAKRIWMVANKIDLNPAAIGVVYCESTICHRNFYLSAKTGEGLQSLREALIDEIVGTQRNDGEANQVITNERHKSCLNNSLAALGRARESIANKLPAEIVSGELRLALSSLEEIVGKTYTEDILGRIFSKFCVGK